MRHAPCVVIFLLILFLVRLPFASGATQDPLPMIRGEGPVDIEADELSYDAGSQRYEGNGHVEITRGDLSLKADHVRMSMGTKEMAAWGHVVLRDGEDVLEAESLEINLDTRLGKIHQARLFMKDQNVHVTGREAEKLGENRYRIREGSFTTCDAKRPPWKFSVKELDVTVGGSGVAKGAVFYLEDIPVLYLPWGTFSLRNERETGFLLPSFGNSSEFGPEVRTAFYWAIAKDMDATFYLNRLGDNRGRGWEEGLEYRYALEKDTKGQANFYYSDDQVYGEDRYAFFYRHQQKFPYDFYLKGDLNYVSDNDYPRDFDQNLPVGTSLDARSLKQVRSVLFGGKNWEQFSFIAEGIAFDDLTQPSNDATVQKLPQVSFFAHPQALLGSPLFFDLSSSYVNFWRQEGTKAHRVDLLPKISFPLRVLNVLKLEAEAGVRETVYRSYGDLSGSLNEWESRTLPEAGVRLSTEFYRVYAPSSPSWISRLFNVARWMHTVEPLIAYRYNSRVDQDDLPLFDDVDRIAYTNALIYGFTQRLVGRPIRERIESGPREYAKLRISQGYSLGDPLETDEKGRGRYFSDVLGELWWHFGPHVTAHGEIGVSPYDGTVKQLNGLISVRSPRNDALQIEYRNTKNEVTQIFNLATNSVQTINPAGSIEALNLSARLRTIGSLYLSGSVKYNLIDHTWAEKIIGAEYQAQCWTTGLVVEHKGSSTTSFNASELTFQVYFNLLGLGSIGGRPGSMRF